MARRAASAVVVDLSRRGLLRPGVKPPSAARGPGALRVLCDAGALDGGLSVALDVRPDEAFGALCSAVGGQASKLKVLDVREQPAALLVRFDQTEESWDVPTLAALVHNLNDLLRSDPEARAIAVLGEWNDALQLWCLPKKVLADSWGAPYFDPLNADDLRSLSRDPEG